MLAAAILKFQLRDLDEETPVIKIKLVGTLVHRPTEECTIENDSSLRHLDSPE
jgi:hypothetical protein